MPSPDWEGLFESYSESYVCDKFWQFPCVLKCVLLCQFSVGLVASWFQQSFDCCDPKWTQVCGIRHRLVGWICVQTAIWVCSKQTISCCLSNRRKFQLRCVEHPLAHGTIPDNCVHKWHERERNLENVVFAEDTSRVFCDLIRIKCSRGCVTYLHVNKPNLIAKCESQWREWLRFSLWREFFSF